MPKAQVKRRAKGQRKKIATSCPLMVQIWKSGIKRTDLMDQLKVTYQIEQRYLKKFCLRLLFDLLKIAFVNLFIVYSKCIGNISTLPRSKNL